MCVYIYIYIYIYINMPCPMRAAFKTRNDTWEIIIYQNIMQSMNDTCLSKYKRKRYWRHCTSVGNS